MLSIFNWTYVPRSFCRISDSGKTLKVRTLGCARSLPLLPIHALAHEDPADELDELTTQKDTRFILVRATVVV